VLWPGGMQGAIASGIKAAKEINAEANGARGRGASTLAILLRPGYLCRGRSRKQPTAHGNSGSLVDGDEPWKRFITRARSRRWDRC
jgi:hypothetical protein